MRTKQLIWIQNSEDWGLKVDSFSSTRCEICLLGSELQRKLDEYKSQNDEAVRLEEELIKQGKQNDMIIGEMADLKQDILTLSRTGI